MDKFHFDVFLFNINPYISVVWQEYEPRIWVGGDEFQSCISLHLNLPPKEIPPSKTIESIDEIVGRYAESHDLFEQNFSKISNEDHFWGICSNLQVWTENNYDSRLLHSSVSFPLLKKLTEMGDPLAKDVFAQEIIIRYQSGSIPSCYFLLIEHYLEIIINTDVTQLFLENNPNLVCHLNSVDENLQGMAAHILLLLYQYGDKQAEMMLNKFNVKSMDFSDEAIIDIPQGIEKLISLQNLILDRLSFPKIPQEIYQLKNLKELSIEYSTFTNISESLGNLKNLQKLSFNHNGRLRTLPHSIVKLTQLRFLDLFFCNIQKLPDDFGNLIHLETLILGSNRLPALPASFAKLTSLQTLHLGNNLLIQFPPSLKSLSKLTSLRLFANQIPSIPDFVCNFNSLEILDLSRNIICHIPELLVNLSFLKTLSLSKNQITRFPKNFGRLTSLTFLDLSHNKLQKLPESFGNLINLKTLYLQGNNLTELPSSFSNLSSLERLNIRNNDFTKLPEFLHLLPKLKWLNNNFVKR